MEQNEEKITFTVGELIYSTSQKTIMFSRLQLIKNCFKKRVKYGGKDRLIN
jgi:hypothetical protein